MPSLSKKPSVQEESIALYSDPHVYKLAALLIGAAKGRGVDHSHYPVDLACFLLDIEARVHGNRQTVDDINRDPRVWSQKARLVHQAAGIVLPATPPSEAVVRKWRSRWLPRSKDPVTQDTPVPETLQLFLEAVSAHGVMRARKFGQFPRGVERDFSRTDPRHCFCADGTYMSPYSQADVWCDPDGHKHGVRSRAGDVGRVKRQDVTHRGEKNGRKFMGVNHVVAITRTPYGRVFLGVERSLKGENAAALTLTERIIGLAGDGVHTLVYDKGYKGWTVDRLMSEHGVNVVLPASARRSEAPQVQEAELDAAAALRRTGNGPAAEGPSKSRVGIYAHKLLAREHDLPGLIDATAKGLPVGVGLPLGTSHYVSSAKKLVVIASEYRHYDDLTHDLPDGTECRHTLYVDDGALWETAFHHGRQVKVQRPACLSSRPQCDPEDGGYNEHTHYQLACRVTGEILDLHTVWIPHRPRRKPSKWESEKRSNAQKALALTQPVARCDARFRKAYGQRNDIESWFFWFKQRILADKRAPSISLDHQLLDIAYAGIITNALALRRYRLNG